jgi:hypothetical protein
MSEVRNANGVTLLEGLSAWEKHERAEGAICNANLLEWACDEIRELRRSRSVEIGAKVGAYREIKATEDEIAKIALAYEQDAADQAANIQGSSDKELRAYAQGRGLTSESIARRLRALLPAAPLAPSA